MLCIHKSTYAFRQHSVCWLMAMLSSLPLSLFTYEVFQGWYTNYKIHPVLSFRQSILLKVRKCRSSLEGLYNHQLCQNFGSYLIALEWHLIHLWKFSILGIYRRILFFEYVPSSYIYILVLIIFMYYWIIYILRRFAFFFQIQNTTQQCCMEKALKYHKSYFQSNPFFIFLIN